MLAKNIDKITISIIFIFLFLMAFYTPFTGDDWAWGSKEGINRLTHWFSHYNGRYAGNIIELVLTRIGLARPFIMALVATYIIVKMVNFTNKKTILYIVVAVLLLMMPLPIFQQTIAWTAGYANYVFPIAIFITYLADLKRIIYEGYQPGQFKIIIMAILAFIGQLFVEHMSIYVLVVSIFSYIYYYLKHQKINPYLFWYMIGAIAGLLFMFSNNSYIFNLLYKDGDRIIRQDNIFLNALQAYAEKVSPVLVYDFAFINLIISLLLAKHASKLSILNYISLLISLLIITSKIILQIPFSLELHAILGIILIVTNFFLILKGEDGLTKRKKAQMTFLYLSAYIVILPLLMVHPFGARNFLFSYILLIMIILLLVERFKFKPLTKQVLVMLSLVLVAQFAYYLIRNSMANNDRVACLKKQSRNYDNTYYLPELPYPQLLWNSTPKSKRYRERFRKYYHLKQKDNMKIIDYQKYEKKHKKICQ